MIENKVRKLRSFTLEEILMVRRGRPRGNAISPLGSLIVSAMKLHSLNYDQVVRESEVLARNDRNNDFRIGKTTLGNIISGRIRQPSTAKLASLTKILQLVRSDVDIALGLAIEKRLTVQLRSRNAQTHEIDKESILRRRVARIPIVKSEASLGSSQFLVSLLDQWVHVEAGYLASLYPPNIRYFVIGDADRFRSPVVPAGSRVLVDTHLTEVPESQNISFHQRELFCVDSRRGLTCCYLEHGVGSRLALVPHPMSGHVREEYAASAINVIGQVVGLLAPAAF